MSEPATNPPPRAGAGAPRPKPAGQRAAAPGEGRVRVEVAGGRSVLTSLYATTPMKLLIPKRSVGNELEADGKGGAAWVYASSFGGGLVSGDTLSLDVAVGPGARAVLTTQASTKVFHADDAGRPATQQLAARVSRGGRLAVVPDPVVCFADAVYEQTQTFRLASGAGLVLLDWFTAGRVAHGERWAFRRFSSRNRVWLDEAEVLHDALVLDRDAGPPAIDDALVTGGYEVFATVALVGAGTETAGVADWLASVAQQPVDPNDAVQVSAGRRGEAVVVSRFAGTSVQAVQTAMLPALAVMDAWAGDSAWSRKW